ncbi:proline-rich proteoglycan 2 isoform X3 [Anolis carolinensis]|uniref:proline-rich proteoglycan 2 isoform X3 n=1 Tax=Anolis carolinensis TaxID=28377 RepID=UPI002F2B68EF
MKTPSEERLKEPGVRPPQPPHPEEGPCVQLWARPSKEEMDKREGSREEPACKEKGGARPRERHLPPAQPFLFQGKKAAGGREQRGRRRPSSARGCSASGRRKGGRAQQPETLGPRPALSGDGGSIAFSCPPPHGAELRSGGFAAAGPGGAGRGGGLDGALPGGPGLGEPPAPVQRPPALHDPRDGLPSGGCPPGLPHLQDGEQAGHQGAPWPPPCPGPPRGAGLVAVFQYHKKMGFPDLYSLHSWCGLLAFAFYIVQWLMGLGAFLFPGASSSLRSRYKPQHAFFGAALFLLSIATALLGILELLLFKIKDRYSAFVPEGLLGNALGLLLVAFGALLGYILTREEWRRPLQGEEMALSMDFKKLAEEEEEGGGSPVDPR